MNQMKNFIIVSLAAFLFSTTAMAVSNPSAVNIKVYGVAVSANADCSNAKVIGYNASGSTLNFLSNPAIASGTIAAGTYHCVVLYMDSAISFTAASNDGACTAGQTYQQVLCNQGNSCTFTQATPDGSNILQYTTDAATPTAANHTDSANSDRILLFLSTSSTNTGASGGSFLRPTAATWATRGLTLTSPLVVGAAGGVGGEFIVNFNGKVAGDGSTGVACGVNAPVMGFR